MTDFLDRLATRAAGTVAANVPGWVVPPPRSIFEGFDDAAAADVSAPDLVEFRTENRELPIRADSIVRRRETLSTEELAEEPESRPFHHSAFAEQTPEFVETRNAAMPPEHGQPQANRAQRTPAPVPAASESGPAASAPRSEPARVSPILVETEPASTVPSRASPVTAIHSPRPMHLAREVESEAEPAPAETERAGKGKASCSAAPAEIPPKQAETTTLPPDSGRVTVMIGRVDVEIAPSTAPVVPAAPVGRQRARTQGFDGYARARRGLRS